MAKKAGGKALNLLVWLTGVIVSLAVGFAMIGATPTLTIPWLDAIGAGIITVIAGWVVIITTVVSVVLVILKQ